MDVSTFGPPVLKAIQTNIDRSLSELNKINPKDLELTTLITDYTKLNDKITTDIDGIANYTATTFPTTLNDINNQLVPEPKFLKKTQKSYSFDVPITTAIILLSHKRNYLHQFQKIDLI